MLCVFLGPPDCENDRSRSSQCFPEASPSAKHKARLQAKDEQGDGRSPWSLGGGKSECMICELCSPRVELLWALNNIAFSGNAGKRLMTHKLTS